MKARFALRASTPWWRGPLLIGIAGLVTILISSIIIRWAGGAPIPAARYIFISPLQSRFGFTEALLSATPLVFTGAAVAIAFRAGYWNIGAEGQLLAGTIGATWVGINAESLPRFIGVPLILLSGMLFGALWALSPALLRTRLGIDEVVTTLLLNPVALLIITGLLNGPWRNTETGFPDSDVIADSTKLWIIWPDTRVHFGLAVGVVIIGLCWWFVGKMSGGLKLRAVGLAPNASRIAGLPVERTLLTTALVSGGIAGLGGASEIAGVAHQLTTGISNNFGYTGVIVATLAALSFIGALFVALMFGVITVGSFSASRALEIPTTIGQVLQAVLLLTVVSALVIQKYQVIWTTNKSKNRE
ncbi:MAG: ABC transporter permease [Ilumatobacteraceae bacterium]|nr:ABC transporter permease [Ilumatobacteraceae bacterium]